MKPFDLENWLSAHSTKIERKGTEIIYTHISNETSILLPADVQQTNLIPIDNEPVASFYRKFSGASIGDSQIMIGSSVVGGIQISHGFRLPDLHQMAATVRELNIVVGSNEVVFMVEAAWMFAYTVDRDGTLRQYDRDFHKSRIIPEFNQILELWWQIVQADL